MEVTDNDLENLINNALVVESDLAEVKTSIKPMDELLDANLMSVALSCQEVQNTHSKYFYLLSDSRASANIDRNAIESFGKDVVPLVDLPESEATLEDLVEAAEIRLQKLTAQVNVYKPAAKPQRVLAALVLHELSITRSAEAVVYPESRRPQENCRGTKKDKEDTKATTAVTPKLDATETKTDEGSAKPTDKSGKAISLVSQFVNLKKWDVIHKFFKQEAQREADEEEYLAKQQELVELKRDIAARLATIKNAKTQIGTAVVSLKTLDGKLGNFQAIWDKLYRDVTELEEFV
ncbi:hypothetical protein M422DRAFT_249339 [Sphaerobolus stellatus SS14]|uniref:DASH complex subunit SPC19 n=1 Tax=Sphaerobolus stellatus (strain SS14) TaxID=990650 RepID=A0A0C9VIA0_SPHS4|nr:hypothetical protein M422DRAFT_249339 [Sphaerobolus stellatus SS14]